MSSVASSSNNPRNLLVEGSERDHYIPLIEDAYNAWFDYGQLKNHETRSKLEKVCADWFYNGEVPEDTEQDVFKEMFNEAVEDAIKHH